MVKPIANIDDPRLVKALAHPLRVRILGMLLEQDLSPVQLADRLEASLQTVAYHVRALADAGLVEEVATRRRRGAIEHIYRATARLGISSHAWERATPVAKQALIGATLQQIAEQAALSASRGGFDRGDAHVTRTVVQLDAHGWTEVATALSRMVEQIADIEARAKDRLARHGDDAAAERAGLVLMLFEAALLSDR